MSYFELHIHVREVRPCRDMREYDDMIMIRDRQNAIYLADRFYNCADVDRVYVVDATTGEMIFKADDANEWFEDPSDADELVHQFNLEIERELSAERNAK